MVIKINILIAFLNGSGKYFTFVFASASEAIFIFFSFFYLGTLSYFGIQKCNPVARSGRPAQFRQLSASQAALRAGDACLMWIPFGWF